MRVLLAAISGQVFLWEYTEGRYFPGLRDGPVKGRWAHLLPLEETILPSTNGKEASQLTIFVMADICLSAFVFTSGKQLVVTILKIQWSQGISSNLGGRGSQKMDIPSKYVRSYWISSVSWSAEGLFFACVLKRGSLLMLARLGGLLTLTSSGCNVDFGLAQFLPLHPLVTYRPRLSAENGEICNSSLSVRDLLRQRFSVTWHPRLLYLIVSDGYMATVMKVQDRHSPALFLKAVLNETCKDLEKASCKLEKSQVHVKAWLESMSWFNSDSSLEELSATVTCRPKGSESTNPAAKDPTRLPLFLQDQQTLGGTRELLESMQAFFEEESDLEGLPAGSHVLDGGRLEFASMFDTLHAMDSHSEFVVDTNHKSGQTEKKNPLYLELGKVQRKLLTAWVFAMSVGDAVEDIKMYHLKNNNCNESSLETGWFP
ncbi:hypothetical protein XENOCAPTIV_007562 [Xenoophorus captivus]|uniref:Uncharacterized protein n=1 Tax=Xenoophorus captivus TaxID=1517983 RepID=A0ABV0QW82_9TELE